MICLALLLHFSRFSYAQPVPWTTRCALPSLTLPDLDVVGPDSPGKLQEIYETAAKSVLHGTKPGDLDILGETASSFLVWAKNRHYNSPALVARAIVDSAPAYCKGQELQYRLYVFSHTDARFTFDDPNVGAYFDPEKATVVVDAARAISKLEPTGFGYMIIPHELAHAIQNNYPDGLMITNSPDWGQEGIAEMLGIEWFRHWHPKKNLERPNRDMPTWLGIRAYARPLNLSTATENGSSQPEPAGLKSHLLDSYRSSSFWSYLREKHGDKLIQDFMTIHYFESCNKKRSIPTQTCFLEEIGALDDVIKASRGSGARGLAFAFPDFLAWHLKRLKENEKRLIADKLTLDEVYAMTFGNCVEIPVHHETSPTYAGTSIDISHLAARCVELVLPGKGELDLFVYAAGSDSDAGAQPSYSPLSMGTLDGQYWTKPVQVFDKRKRPIGAEWKFKAEGGKAARFFLSNVMLQASATKPLRVTLEASVNRFNSSMSLSEEGKKPAKESGNASNSAPPAGLSAQSSFSIHVRRSEEEWPCADAFQFLPCGARMSIDLILVPAMVDNIGTQVGGTLADPKGGIIGSWMADAKRTEKMDGSEIVLSIPLIDYGFSGTFQNASIDVHSSSHSGYTAIGPADALPGPGNGYPLSGIVDIEEYTPWIMRGAFSAELVKREPQKLLGDDEARQVMATISGRFNIASPWKGDNRYHGVAANDPLYWASGLDNKVSGPAPSAGARAGSSRQPISMSSKGDRKCDCSCNYRDTAPLACMTTCSNEFLACEGKKYIPTAAQNSANDIEVAALRKKFIEGLTSTMPDMVAFQEAAVKSFDEAASIEAKQSVYEVYLGALPD